MRDALKSYLTLAGGVTDLTRQRAVAAARALVSQGEATAEQVTGLAEDLIAQTRQNREAVSALVGYEVERALARVGLATTDEVAALNQRIQLLEKQLVDAQQQAGGAPPKATSKAPSRAVAAVTAAPGRTGAPAKKGAPGKKGAPAKAGASAKAPAKKAAPLAAPSAKKGPGAKTGATAKVPGEATLTPAPLSAETPMPDPAAPHAAAAATSGAVTSGAVTSGAVTSGGGSTSGAAAAETVRDTPASPA